MTDSTAADATLASIAKPATKPARPHFSSGPCAKPPGWDAAKLATEVLGRSHRSKLGKTRLQYCIDLMREMLRLPDTHRIGIVPGSDTGAFEMAMWTMLGARGVTTLAWESFGEGWVTDAVKQLKLDPTVIRADYGQLPDLSQVDFADDVLFTWNGTTSGVRVPNGDWIPDDREGLTFADSTSAVFAYDLPWDKIDVATFSWQKVLGGEGGHGVLILGPRAVERLEQYTPAWPLPKVFRLMAKGKLAEGVFKGETINTPSMLAVEDAIFALEWAKGLGGLDGLIARSDANAAALDKIVAERDWLGHLAADEATRSKTSVCLTVEGADEAFIKTFASLLEKADAAYDVAGYRDAPAGLRIWCGATVDTADIEALGPWLDWAYASAKASN
ncbi:phosphoserine transaminase [Sphingomonas koreensis]|jgi:phosphoserine aminotransferase|uniref:phosphoserine transaminase n=1 Tax=Sphingomonas koreensis TaxID=93064 RepID=A0A1L6J831_9SPHN|nr:phosphoserine transaminase [Sphingomonas koreensis]APR51710.1 phosphoserine aminotransferase [Sphingomonas koreensis]MDC7811881.1 phosphoserine transaminase [Sphingomonas koreensis]RSU21326.1 phosphoserine transaminase [Sphingomonas koreensis]RSU23682.1 phosphoserine transaminase [Sphingomonas koreensis]RSU32109.1 phosphoserine transaminase [Sphingomonas koreensis]